MNKFFILIILVFLDFISKYFVSSILIINQNIKINNFFDIIYIKNYITVRISIVDPIVLLAVLILIIFFIKIFIVYFINSLVVNFGNKEMVNMRLFLLKIIH